MLHEHCLQNIKKINRNRSAFRQEVTMLRVIVLLEHSQSEAPDFILEERTNCHRAQNKERIVTRLSVIKMIENIKQQHI